EKSFYIGSKNLKTPMGYGLAALKEKGPAESLAKEKEGEVLENFDKATNWLLSGETTIKGENRR
ncbi:MAG TPA: hypothetical protein VHT73_18335, partial [Thermodesulfobacteriota bacterium]|nr:hypothetical protein [Thermodesulfobacteriota bacterium]